MSNIPIVFVILICKKGKNVWKSGSVVPVNTCQTPLHQYSEIQLLVPGNSLILSDLIKVVTVHGDNGYETKFYRAYIC